MFPQEARSQTAARPNISSTSCHMARMTLEHTVLSEILKWTINTIKNSYACTKPVVCHLGPTSCETDLKI